MAYFKLGDVVRFPYYNFNDDYFIGILTEMIRPSYWKVHFLDQRNFPVFVYRGDSELVHTALTEELFITWLEYELI